MLAILSEINCLDYINGRGIYPDEYFTDYEMFKNRYVSYKDATVVVILAGTCRFSKRHVIELIKNLYKRVENEKDTSIKNVFVISDSVINNLDVYYKFEGNLDICKKCSYQKEKKEVLDIWLTVDEYQTQTAHESAIFYSDFDKCNLGKLNEPKNKKASTEDELIRLIKKPDVKSIVIGK